MNVDIDTQRKCKQSLNQIGSTLADVKALIQNAYPPESIHAIQVLEQIQRATIFLSDFAKDLDDCESQATRKEHDDPKTYNSGINQGASRQKDRLTVSEHEIIAEALRRASEHITCWCISFHEAFRPPTDLFNHGMLALKVLLALRCDLEKMLFSENDFNSEQVKKVYFPYGLYLTNEAAK